MKSFLYFLSLIFITFSCSSPNQERKPSVIVTLSPYHYFVHEIAQDTLDVSCVISEGKNPHSYEPTFKDTQKIIDASIWFYLNEPFEEKILSSFTKNSNKNLLTVDLCESITLISSSCHKHCHAKAKDRHLWLSPKSARKQCEMMADSLCKTFPQHEPFYRSNAKKLLDRLTSLDKKISSLLSPWKGKTIFVSHPAFAYLCQDYHLHQLFLQQEDKELHWQNLEELLKQAKEKKLTTLFHQKQYNYQDAKRIASHLDLSIVMIDPFAENYFENMERIATLFANSIKESHEQKSRRM